MRVAIIGKGNVGTGLAARFTATGHDVVVGVRDPDTADTGGVAAASVAEAAAGADVVVLAVPARAVDAVLDAVGSLDGVVVVDATNPVRFDGGIQHAPPVAGSQAAHVQARRPGARVVKAWNTFGAEFHASPRVGGQPVTVLMAGDDAAAKATVAALAEDGGWAPLDAGPLRNAAALEQQAVLWIHLAMTGQGRDFTFQVVHDR